MKKIKSILPVSVWLGLAAFVWYIPGIARAPMPGDSSVYLVRSWTLWLNSYAQTHPLYLILGHICMKLLPFLSPPIVLGLLSALCAAGTVTLIYLITRQLAGGSQPAALFASVSLIVSHTFWYHAVFAEVYSLNTLLSAAIILAAFRWHHVSKADSAGAKAPGSLPLFLMGLAGGLGIANHLLAALTLFVCLLWVFFSPGRYQSRVFRLAVIGLGGFIGSFPILCLFIRDVHHLGLTQAVKMFFFGGMGIRGHHAVFYSSDMVRLFSLRGLSQFGLSILALIYNFPGLLLILGLLWIRRRGYRQANEARTTSVNPSGWTFGLLVAVFAIQFFYGATYTIHEGWAFLLPAWLPLACLLGYWLDRALGRQRPRLRALALIVACPVVLYALAPPLFVRLAGHRLETKLAERAFPTPAQYARFYLWPPKSGASWAALAVKNVLTAAEPDARVLLSPANNAIAYYYQTVEGLRPDLFVRGTSQSQVDDALADGVPAYVDRLKEIKNSKAPDKRVTKDTRLLLWKRIP